MHQRHAAIFFASEDWSCVVCKVMVASTETRQILVDGWILWHVIPLSILSVLLVVVDMILELDDIRLIDPLVKVADQLEDLVRLGNRDLRHGASAAQ